MLVPTSSVALSLGGGSSAGLAGVVSLVASCAEASSGVWSGAAAGAGSSGEKVTYHAA